MSTESDIKFFNKMSTTENDDLKFYNKMNTENDDNHNESALNSSQDSEKNLWSPEEIIVLINVWEEYNKDLRKLGRHAKTYHQITERLQHILDREVPFTVRQVIKKIENLKRQYNYNKNKFQSEANPSPWRYYKMIHRFIHASPKDDKTLGKEELSVYHQNPPVEVLLEDGLAQMLEQDLLRLRGEQTEETDSDSRSPTASSVSTPALQSVTPTITNAPSTSTPAVNLPPQHQSESSFGSEGGAGGDLTQPVRDCHSSPSRKRSKNYLDFTNVTDWVSDDESNFEDLLEEYFHKTSYELELMKNALTYFFTDTQNDELEFLLLDSLGGHQLKLIYWKELMTLRRDGERIRNEALKDIIREVNQGQTEDILRERLKQQNLNYENFLQLHKWRESRISSLERELKGVVKQCQNECESRLEFLLGRLDSRGNGIESKGANLELKIDKILDLLVSSSSRMPRNGLKENSGC